MINLSYQLFYMTRMLKDKIINKVYNSWDIESNRVVKRMENSEMGLLKSIYNLTYEPTFIIDNIYLGNGYNASSWNILKKYDIDTVINISYEIPNYYTEDIKYYNIKIYDINETDILIHLDDFIKFIKNEKKKKEKKNILIHCYMGSSRSASLVVAYLCRYHGFNVENAINFIKDKRELININIKFIEDLKKWNKE